jgi:hypothetical protein
VIARTSSRIRKSPADTAAGYVLGVDPPISQGCWIVDIRKALPCREIGLLTQNWSGAVGQFRIAGNLPADCALFDDDNASCWRTATGDGVGEQTAVPELAACDGPREEATS